MSLVNGVWVVVVYIYSIRVCVCVCVLNKGSKCKKEKEEENEACNGNHSSSFQFMVFCVCISRYLCLLTCCLVFWYKIPISCCCVYSRTNRAHACCRTFMGGERETVVVGEQYVVSEWIMTWLHSRLWEVGRERGLTVNRNEVEEALLLGFYSHWELWESSQDQTMAWIVFV